MFSCSEEVGPVKRSTITADSLIRAVHSPLHAKTKANDEALYTATGINVVDCAVSSVVFVVRHRMVCFAFTPDEETMRPRCV